MNKYQSMLNGDNEAKELLRKILYEQCERNLDKLLEICKQSELATLIVNSPYLNDKIPNTIDACILIQDIPLTFIRTWSPTISFDIKDNKIVWKHTSSFNETIV